MLKFDTKFTGWDNHRITYVYVYACATGALKITRDGWYYSAKIDASTTLCTNHDYMTINGMLVYPNRHAVNMSQYLWARVANWYNTLHISTQLDLVCKVRQIADKVAVHGALSAICGKSMCKILDIEDWHLMCLLEQNVSVFTNGADVVIAMDVAGVPTVMESTDGTLDAVSDVVLAKIEVDESLESLLVQACAKACVTTVEDACSMFNRIISKELSEETVVGLKHVIKDNFI